MAPTIRETLATIRALGARVRYDDGEWRVNVPNGTEATAYYTDDADDALATAQAMMANPTSLTYCAFCGQDKPDDEVRHCDSCGETRCDDDMSSDERCDCGGSF